jgi:hypothetical protein
MNTTRKLMLVLSVVLLAAPMAHALSLERTYIESYHGRSDIPVPIKVVSPDVDSAYAGTVVELVFTVDSMGAPQNIEVRTPVDHELARVLTGAVRHWRFAPERRDGQAQAAKVVLPIRIVEKSTD